MDSNRALQGISQYTPLWSDVKGGPYQVYLDPILGICISSDTKLLLILFLPFMYVLWLFNSQEWWLTTFCSTMSAMNALRWGLVPSALSFVITIALECLLCPLHVVMGIGPVILSKEDNGMVLMLLVLVPIMVWIDMDTPPLASHVIVWPWDLLYFALLLGAVVESGLPFFGKKLGPYRFPLRG